MKRIVVAALLIAGTAAWAQVSNPSIVLVVSAPSGSCTQNLPDQQVVSLGTIYTCQSGTWALVGGGSGTFVTLSGDATSTSTGGATVVHGINSVLLSSLSSCILYNTTGTGVPSCATAAQLGTLVALPQYSIPYSAGTTSALTDVASPTVNGSYALGWTVVGSAAVAPAAITLGTAALDNTGTSGATIPLLNGANTYSAIQTFSVAPILTGLTGYVYANGSSQVGAATTIPLGSIVSTAGTLAPLYLANATSGLLTIQPADGAITSYTLKLPNAQPTSGNTFLSCTAANPAVCTWVAGGSGSSGLSGMTQYGIGVAASATTVTSSVQPASWTTGHTFVPVWQPSGSALAPTTVDANTLVVSSASSATTATNATNVATTTKSDNTEYYLGLYPANSSSNQAAVVVGAHYNASTGAITLPAGASLGTSDTGTPRLTASTNLWTSNVPFSAPSLLSGTPSAGAQAALPTGAHGMAVDETSTAGVPAAGVDYLRADATSHRIKQSLNGGAEVNVPIPSEIPAAQVAANLASSGSTGVTGVLPVANGGTGSAVADTTFTVSTSTTINANSCTPASGSGGTSVTMTNLTSAMTLAITPNADITNTTGWGNPAAGVLYVTLAPGSGAFTYHVCNNTASNITTNGAATFNVSAR